MLGLSNGVKKRKKIKFITSCFEPEERGFSKLKGCQNSDYLSGYSKMPRCKAPEILRNEAYLDVRRNDEG
jgi:hypothetical protein